MRCSAYRRAPNNNPTIGGALLLCLLGQYTTACAQLTQVSVAQKTTLELQLLGELEPLSDEDTLAASIRVAQGPMKITAAGTIASLKEMALRARQRQLFNRDDINVLLLRGCLGEAQTGYLAPRPCNAPNALERTLSVRMRAEENQDRDHIITWVIENDETLTPGDRYAVLGLYGSLRRAHLRPGMTYEDDTGAWNTKTP